MEVKIEQNRVMINLGGKDNQKTIRQLVDYARYLEASSGSMATQNDADALADEVNSKWWEQNKSRFGL